MVYIICCVDKSDLLIEFNEVEARKRSILFKRHYCCCTVGNVCDKKFFFVPHRLQSFTCAILVFIIIIIRGTQ